jgi:hypothetical protein
MKNVLVVALVRDDAGVVVRVGASTEVVREPLRHVAEDGEALRSRILHRRPVGLGVFGRVLVQEGDLRVSFRPGRQDVSVLPADLLSGL